MERVIEFVERHSLLEKVKGSLSYQLPDQEKRVEIVAKNIKQLRDWGNKLLSHRLGENGNGENLRLQLGTARALSEILPRSKGPDITRTIPNEMPKFLVPFCQRFEEHNYLLVDKMLKHLFPLLASLDRAGKTKSAQAAYFPHHDSYIFWLSNPENPASPRRLVIKENGRFWLRDPANAQNNISGSLCGNETMVGVKDDPKLLLRDFLQKIWRKLPKMGVNPCLADKQTTEEGSKIIHHDGTIHPTVSKKPIVCQWNPISGFWYLDLELFSSSKDQFARAGKDFDFPRIAEAIKAGKPKQCLCPVPSHENLNTKSRAAHYYPDDGVIMCYGGCGRIEIGHGDKDSIPNIPRAVPNQVEAYHPVRYEDERSLRKIHIVSAILARHSQELQEYLTLRGFKLEELAPLFDPEQIIPKNKYPDIDQVGYVPPSVSRALSNLVSSEGFDELCKQRGGKSFRLDDLSKLLVHMGIDCPNFAPAVDEVLRVLEENIPDPKHLDVVLKMLTTGSMSAMANRGIITRNKEFGKGPHFIGGRVLFFTRWALNHGSRIGDKLDHANLNGREVSKEHNKKVTGPVHFKFWSRRAPRPKSGEPWKQDTPSGIYVAQREEFLEQIQQKKELVIAEGPFSTASLGKILPKYKHLSLTATGTEVRDQLVAILRWLGVEGDSKKTKRCQDAGLKKVYLAYDFGDKGAGAYWKTKRLFKEEFPGLEVLPVHDILPQNILNIIKEDKHLIPPSYNEDLFRDGGAYANTEEIDMNDVLLYL